MRSFQLGGIAYDWLSKNLYWSDELNRTISVVMTVPDSNSLVYRKTLVTANLSSPSDVAVDPLVG